MAVYRSDGVLLRVIVPDKPSELDDPAHSEGGLPVRFVHHESFRLHDVIAIAHVIATSHGIPDPRTQE